MKSEPGIVPDDGNKTRSRHPGSSERPRSSPSMTRTSGSGKSGFPADARYWGRVNSQGEFEQASNFPDPPDRPFRFPWRALGTVVRGFMPSAVAAFVGAVTALSWQAVMVKPQDSAPTSVVNRPVTTASPSGPVSEPAVIPPAGHAPPAAGEPRTAIPAARESGAALSMGAVARPAAPSRPRAVLRRAITKHTVAGSSARRTPRAIPVDEDGILEPTF